MALVWAFFPRSWTPRYCKALTLCLGFSTAYLGWTLVAQQMMSGRAETLLASRNITPERLIATPTPFNTLLWRVIVIEGNRSFNLYMPVFGGADRATLCAYDRNLQLEACAGDDPRIAKVARFCRGFYRILVRGDAVSVADLRMGLSPNYAFRFSLGRLEGGTLVPGPTRRMEGRGDIGKDIDWLLANLRGVPATRLAEAAAKVEPPQRVALGEAALQPKRAC